MTIDLKTLAARFIHQPCEPVPHDIEAPLTHQGLRPYPAAWTSTHAKYLAAVMVPWLVRLGPADRPMVAKLWFNRSCPWPGSIGEHWLHQLRQLGHRPQYGIGDDVLELYDATWVAQIDARALFNAARSDTGERLHLPAARIER